MRLLIATKNPAKLKEIQRFLGDSFELVSLPADAPEVQETGETFQENAILKAKTYHALMGIPTVADDGGLEIDALGGEPGVHSRRWPGHEATDRELIDIALAKLADIPPERRQARFRVVGAYFDGVRTFTETAQVEGVITDERPQHWDKGLPFRSIFLVPQFGKLFRDLTHAEHDQINYRQAVFTKLRDRILSAASR